ncbi:MAG: hypothetical protein ACR2IE_16515 [Candidatus Sumerlaeaceae bacterium]
MPQVMDPPRIAQVLNDGKVAYIVVGGVAATLHGSPRLTRDFDIVYQRTTTNYKALEIALKPHNPYLRGAPPGLPFSWDSETIQRGLNFTLTTDLGDIDCLGEIVGGGGYENLLPFAIPATWTGVSCMILGLEKLIEVKRAAGRPKDIEAISELEALLEEHLD